MSNPYFEKFLRKSAEEKRGLDSIGIREAVGAGVGSAAGSLAGFGYAVPKIAKSLDKSKVLTEAAARSAKQKAEAAAFKKAKGKNISVTIKGKDGKTITAKKPMQVSQARELARKAGNRAASVATDVGKAKGIGKALAIAGGAGIGGSYIGSGVGGAIGHSRDRLTKAEREYKAMKKSASVNRYLEKLAESKDSTAKATGRAIGRGTLEAVGGGALGHMAGRVVGRGSNAAILGGQVLGSLAGQIHGTGASIGKTRKRAMKEGQEKTAER